MSLRDAAPAPAASSLEPATRPAGAHPLLERYLDAQLRGDRAAALAVVEEGRGAGLGVADLELRIVCAAQREVGSLWENGRITIADEHAATAISQLALAHLYRHLPRGEATGKKVVVTCVDGELHDMGARVLSDFFEIAGFEVRFLGANVPTASLVDLASREQPDLVALSVSLPQNAHALRAAVAGLRGRAHASTVLAAGGAAATPTLLAEIGLLPFGTDALQAVAAARGALGLPASDGSPAARELARASAEPLREGDAAGDLAGDPAEELPPDARRSGAYASAEREERGAGS